MLFLGLNVLETRAWTQTKVTKLQQWRITRSGKNSKRKPLLFFLSFFLFFFLSYFSSSTNWNFATRDNKPLTALKCFLRKGGSAAKFKLVVVLQNQQLRKSPRQLRRAQNSFGVRLDPLEQAQFNVSRLYLNTLFGLWNKEIWCFSFWVETGFRIEFSFELVWFPLCRWKDGRGWTHKPRG